MSKITLTVNGQELSFSKEELSAILEQNCKEELSTILERNCKEEPISISEQNFSNPKTETIEIVKTFDVDPRLIDQTLFQEKREDQLEENTRIIILEAFEELKNNPEKYDKPFQTLWIKKTWDYKTVEELEYMVKNVGGHMTDWVEQSFEWAQRIANCEAWKHIRTVPYADDWAWQIIRNIPSPDEQYRLVRWKNGKPIFVSTGWDDYSDSYVGSNNNGFVYNGNYYPDCRLMCAVPSIVRYTK